MTYEPDPDREIFVATAGGETSHSLDMLRAVAPGVAIFEERGRVTGWREAIEALRLGAEDAFDAAADFLQSLAPKDADG